MKGSENSGLPPELAGMLSSLLSNPAALSAVGSLLGGGLGNLGGRGDERERCDFNDPREYEDRRERKERCDRDDRCDRSNRCEHCDRDDRCDRCTRGGCCERCDERPTYDDCDDCPKAPPILPPTHPKKEKHPKKREDSRGELLCALRPFLSPERCEMIESILRILELLEVVRRRR